MRWVKCNDGDHHHIYIYTHLFELCMQEDVNARNCSEHVIQSEVGLHHSILCAQGSTVITFFCSLVSY